MRVKPQLSNIVSWGVTPEWGAWHLGTHQASDSPPEVLNATVSTRVDIRASQIQAVSVVAVIRGRRPIDAVTATTVIRTADEAGIEEVNWILAPSQ